jgi:hypothetical protein
MAFPDLLHLLPHSDLCRNHRIRLMNHSCFWLDNMCVPKPLVFLTSSYNVTLQSDPGDAFNQFWNIMQGMLDNLSQPVAFATIPLGNDSNPASGTKTPPLPRRDGSLSSDTDVEEPMLSRLTRRIGMNRNGRSALRGSLLGTSSTKPDDDFDDSLFDEGKLHISNLLWSTSQSIQIL